MVIEETLVVVELFINLAYTIILQKVDLRKVDNLNTVPLYICIFFLLKLHVNL